MSVSKSSFKTITLSGTTNSSPDVQQLFVHNGKAIPKWYSTQSGDVYIPSTGLGMNTVDVRSHQASMKFSIVLFF